MKKKRITISVKKAAVLLSIICAVGVAGLALSIMLAPAQVRVASVPPAVSEADDAGKTAAVPSAVKKDTIEAFSPKETVSLPSQIPSRLPETGHTAAADKAQSTSKPVVQGNSAESQKKPAQTLQPSKSVASPAKTPQPARAVPVSGKRDKPSIPVSPPVESKTANPDTAIPLIPHTQKPPLQTVPAGSAGTLVFVFDDAGHNLAQLQKFLALPFPVTIAVLPSLPYSAQAAQQIRAAGKEVILHQPMQAKNLAMDPGPGAITRDMNPGEIFKLVTENVRQIAPIAGMNNHEGSLITESEEQITAVLDVCRMEGIYFLDSRTTAQTAAPVVAAEKKMKIWERAIFLDNSKKRADMEQSLLDGLKVAEKKGLAILIGHVWSPELADLLQDWYPQLQSRGFVCTTISTLIRGNK